MEADIIAIAGKVGVNGSGVTSSHTYKITQLEGDVATAQSDITDLQSDVDALPTVSEMNAAIAAALATRELPVGSLYMNKTNSANPNSILGYGTWVAVEDQMIMAVGPTYTAGTTGGSATHSHPLSAAGQAQVLISSGNAVGAFVAANFTSTRTNTGGGSATAPATNATPLMGNTDAQTALPPYFTAYVWERTA